MKQASFPGDELRARREELGLSLYEAYRQTRVPSRCIAALERNDLTVLPEECYVVGFLKTYCTFLGLEPDRFTDAIRGQALSPRARFLRRTSELRREPPAWLHESLTWAAILAVLALGWFSYAALFRPQAEVTEKRVDAGTVDMVLPPAPVEPGV